MGKYGIQKKITIYLLISIIVIKLLKFFKVRKNSSFYFIDILCLQES